MDKPKADRSAQLTPESVARRWEQIGASDAARDELADAQTLAQLARFARNIENFIGPNLWISGPTRRSTTSR